MSNTVYGNIITSGSYSLRAYAIYDDAVQDDNSVSVTVNEIGFKRGGNSLSLSTSGMYSTSAADDHSVVKNVLGSSTWTTTNGTKPVIVTPRTFTWQRSYADEHKTITIDSVKPSGTMAGTSEIEIDILVPAIDIPPGPEPEWTEPVYDRIAGSRTSADDMNRIAGNLHLLGGHSLRWNYADGDFVKDREWNAIVEGTNVIADELNVSRVTSKTVFSNLNRIENIHKLYHDILQSLYPSDTLLPSDDLYPQG